MDAVEAVRAKIQKLQNDMIASRAVNEKSYNDWVASMRQLPEQYQQQFPVDLSKSFADYFPSLYAERPNKAAYEEDRRKFVAVMRGVEDVREKFLAEVARLLE